MANMVLRIRQKQFPRAHYYPCNGDWVRIPGSSGQGFRFDPATHSNLIRPPIPGHPATLFG
jgi:hypothetical protein